MGACATTAPSLRPRGCHSGKPSRTSSRTTVDGRSSRSSGWCPHGNAEPDDRASSAAEASCSSALDRASLLVVDQREDPLDVPGGPPEHRSHLARIDTLVTPTDEAAL